RCRATTRWWITAWAGWPRARPASSRSKARTTPRSTQSSSTVIRAAATSAAHGESGRAAARSPSRNRARTTRQRARDGKPGNGEWEGVSMIDLTNRFSRRGFVGALGALGLGATGLTLASCSEAETSAARAADDHMEHTSSPAATPTKDYAEMDRMHEAGVKAFPAETKGLGGQPLSYELDGDVKVFRLTCQKVQWETEPGRVVEAWAYNGVVPGPEIRVTEGDNVRIHVTNELDESTAVHWHGLMVPNSMDGVPFITQPPIRPGETFTYEFVAKPAGSHMYHSHHNAAEQVTMGLLGAFIVEPKDPSTRPAYDVEYTLILNDGPLGF